MPKSKSKIPFVRTPECRFQHLKDYSYKPKYVCLKDKLRMAYVDVGKKCAKETLLLLHGEPAWGYLYRKMIPPLKKQGYRVIVPDLIGFGRSDKATDPLAYT